MTTSALTHPYREARVALLTQHGKERVVAPVLRTSLEAELVVASGFDTDTLGTFTRDIPREGTQLEAARRKATLACELSGLRLGLGSEGSFGPSPFGFGTWNVELIVLVDRELGIEITGTAQGPGHAHHGTLRDAGELAAFAQRAGFPSHGLVVRPSESAPPVRKGLQDWASLTSAFDEALGLSPGGAFVESDLRAHQHPTRMARIAEAAADLIERIRSLCPECGRPGFARVAVEAGLPCEACGAPTQVPVADVHRCVSCPHQDKRPRSTGRLADPSRCDVCNP